MSKVINFPRNPDTEDNFVLERIKSDVAVQHDGQGITLDGAGSVDFYLLGSSLGISVTTSTGMTVLASISQENTQKIIDWILRRKS